MTFNDFLEQLFKIRSDAQTEDMRQAAEAFYVEIGRTVFEGPIENANTFFELFENNV